MDKLHNVDVERLFHAILSLNSVDECYKFFEDVCTVKEIIDMAQRLKAAKLLDDGVNYVSICEATGMSTATIGRVKRCLDYGRGGYQMILERLDASGDCNDK